jgi:protein disulfide-isomerase
MNRRNVLVAAGALLGLAIVGAASEPVYDEQADAHQQIAAAIKTASQRSKPAKNIVLMFGANWCPDCHVLDEQMQKPGLASLIEKSFVVVKIDVGSMDKNVDVAKKYGVPIKNGIPALAILDSRGQLLYAQDQGQFADARHLTFESIRVFFDQWKPKV